jgi:hypothetical protein
MSEWYFVKAGERQGPVAAEVVQTGLKSGELPPETLVWKAGLTEWVAASTQPELTAASGGEMASPAPGIDPVISGAPGSLRAGDIFNEALALFKADWKSFSLVALVYCLIIGGIGRIPLVGTWLPSLLAGVLLVGLWKGLLAKMDGKPLEVGCLFSAFDRFVPATLINLLVTVVVVIGLILLIVPGVIAALALQFWPALMVDKNMKGMDALRTSFEIAKPHLLTLFLLALLSAVIAIAGLICLIVGIIPACGLIFALWAVTYRKLIPRSA